MIQLMDELLMMQQYLDLEKIRFDKRLTYHFKLENQSLNFRIPSMSLYLLVENAIKHGVSKLRKGGELFIHTRSEETHLYIIVRNTGVLEKKDNFYGTSLKTSKEDSITCIREIAIAFQRTRRYGNSDLVYSY
jgi:LytS/YehU family sensor histidine kinase